MNTFLKFKTGLILVISLLSLNISFAQNSDDTRDPIEGYWVMEEELTQVSPWFGSKKEHLIGNRAICRTGGPNSKIQEFVLKDDGSLGRVVSTIVRLGQSKYYVMKTRFGSHRFHLDDDGNSFTFDYMLEEKEKSARYDGTGSLVKVYNNVLYTRGSVTWTKP